MLRQKASTFFTSAVYDHFEQVVSPLQPFANLMTLFHLRYTDAYLPLREFPLLNKFHCSIAEPSLIALGKSNRYRLGIAVDNFLIQM